MQYESYMPHINVTEGLGRVRGNLRLYKMLLEKFKGTQMVDDLISAILDCDLAKIVQFSHALRGTAANLGFTRMCNITDQIEAEAKAGQNPQQHIAELADASRGLADAIARASEEL